MNGMTGFCEVLRGLRCSSGLTQRELADLSALSVRAVRDLERGKVRRPRRETVRLLADALRLEGDRRATFEALACQRREVVVGSSAPITADAAEEVHGLAELLVAERRRLAAAGRVGLVVAQRLSPTGDWSVIWMFGAAA